MLLSGCGPGAGTTPESKPAEGGGEAGDGEGDRDAEPGGEAPSETPANVDPPPAPSAEDATALAGAINALGANVYGEIRATQKGNFAISPASIHVALTMTWAGAKGATGTEMGDVLHLGRLGEDKDAAAVAGGQLGVWNGAESITLRTANRLFGEKTYDFLPEFLGATKSKFGAPLEPVDYKNAFEAARLRINDWVMKQTEDRIEDLLPERSLDANTRLVLVNAVYFLADWVEPFEESATTDAAFEAPGGEVQVPTMHATRDMGYADIGDVELVRLDYKGGGYAMMVAVPKAAKTLADVESQLNGELVASWWSGLKSEKIDLAFPRFEIDPAGSVALKQALKNLGMVKAFDAELADFSGIADPPNPADRLYVGEVFHQCFVKVDEKGTEAAAATAVVMARGGGAPAPPKKVTVDRPFLFFVMDKTTGAVLFMGRVLDPLSKG